MKLLDRQELEERVANFLENTPGAYYFSRRNTHFKFIEAPCRYHIGVDRWIVGQNTIAYTGRHLQSLTDVKGEVHF